MSSDTSAYPDRISAARESQLCHRQRAFDILRSKHAHILWLPRFVDVAVNNFGGAANIEDITSDPRFYQNCEAANRRFGYPGFVWTRSVAEGALTDANCPFLHMFLRRHAATLSKTWGNRAQDREVIFDTLRSEYFKLVEEYRVGEVGISGHVRSWGYEAFFASRLPGRTHARLHRRFRELTNSEDEIIAIADRADRCADFRELRKILRLSLRSVLYEEWQREVFRRLIYTRCDAKAVAADMGHSAADIHRFLVAPLVRELQRAFGVSSRPRFYFGSELRQSFAALVSEVEFLRLFDGC